MRQVAIALALCTLASGCAATSGTPAAARPSVTSERGGLLPAGFGTLRQDDITLAMRSGDLLIKATPLEENLIRLTAPDTYERLRSLRETYREELERRAPSPGTLIVLVSFFSYEPNVLYQPEDLNVLSLGLRFRPTAVVPVTAGWGTQRLNQQQTAMALYAFDAGIDLDNDLEVEYQDVRNAAWERVLSVIQAERAKVQARGGP